MAYPAASGPDFGRDPAEFTFFSALLSWLGAGLSVALVAGLVWWAYDIAMRDSRAVPVVRAMEGPARVAPDEPGGFRAAHTGYAVNSIAGEESRAPVADEVSLAPAPAAVEDGDVPTILPGAAPEDAAIRSSVDRALMDALGIEPTSGVAPADGGGSTDQSGQDQRPADGLAEVSRSLPTQPLPLVPVAAAAAGAGPIAPLDIAPGTRLVQLGAYPTETEAQAAWTRLNGNFSEYFGDKRPVYEETNAAGQTLWRLRAHGFEGRAEARRFCEVLLAGQAECIPVLTR